MRRDLAGNGQALGLGGAHHVQAALGGDVLDVQLGTGQACERDIALDLQLLALGRPAEHAQACGDDALVDLALAHEAGVLAVAHENLAEHDAVVHDAAHHAGVLDAAAVISEGNGAAGDHVAHLGERLALEAARARTGGVHAAVAHFGGAGLDVLDHDAVIGAGVGVGHGAHTGETALGGGAGTALDVLLVLLARVAQVHVHVHQAGDEVLTGQVHDLGIGGSLQTLAHRRDLLALEGDVHNAVKPGNRVDHVCVLKQKGHYRHLQAAGKGRPCARRCPHRPVPG